MPASRAWRSADFEPGGIVAREARPAVSSRRRGRRWAPVENAALMPWLASTAFLHSVMVQEKKGMLKVWNMLLVILAFSLSLFGTFLTRSGVLNSIHSFTESSIGPWFLGMICFVVAASS